jgi:hypothetical protein
MSFVYQAMGKQACRSKRLGWYQERLNLGFELYGKLGAKLCRRRQCCKDWTANNDCSIYRTMSFVYQALGKQACESKRLGWYQQRLKLGFELRSKMGATLCRTR